MLSEQIKANITNAIYERAYEIECKLSEDDFFMAKMAGLKPEQVAEVSLNVAIKELQKVIN